MVMTANQASSVKWQNTAISLSVQLVKVRSPGKEETEVVVGETVVNVEASAGVVGVEVVDGEAGAGVVDDAVAAGERSTVVGATVEISSSIFSNLGA